MTSESDPLDLAPAKLGTARSKWPALVELLRIPNLFTAVSNSWAGYLMVQGPSWFIFLDEFAGLAVASAAFYAAGVVLNDVADLSRDRVSRPERPLPSGRLSENFARRLGFALLAVACTITVGLSAVNGSPWPAVLGGLLASAIVGYDFVLKSTLVGFAVMGLCRSLNLFLGMTVAWPQAGFPIDFALLWAGIALGLYVGGITLFARREEAGPARRELLAGAALMGVAFAMLAILPAIPSRIPRPTMEWPKWLALVAVTAGLLAFRAARALIRPTSPAVKRVVKQAILWIVVWDAVACYAFTDATGAILILLLLVPAALLGAWVSPT